MVSHQHGTALCYRQNGFLLIGPPGCGKSTLGLHLVQQGCDLIADDQVILRPSDPYWLASCPEILCGRLHVRGRGFIDVHPHAEAPVTCIFQSTLPAFALSTPPALDVPVVALDFFRPDAAAFVLDRLTAI